MPVGLCLNAEPQQTDDLGSAVLIQKMLCVIGIVTRYVV